MAGKPSPAGLQKDPGQRSLNPLASQTSRRFEQLGIALKVEMLIGITHMIVLVQNLFRGWDQIVV